MNLHLLNKEQKIAVEHQKGPLLVLSGAGTGKTRVLTSRFVYIVKNLKFDFNRIIAVTFTNKAANEIKERVKKALDQNIESPWIGTFHSIFAKFLRKHAHHVGLKSNFNILDSEDQKKLIKQVLEYCKIDKEVSESIYLNEIQNLNKMFITNKTLYKNIQKGFIELINIIKKNHYENENITIYVLSNNKNIAQLESISNDFKYNSKIVSMKNVIFINIDQINLNDLEQIYM